MASFSPGAKCAASFDPNDATEVVLSAAADGSSTFVARALLLEEPPSLDAREMTDKGSINQKVVLQRRAALVDELYSTPPSARTLVAAAPVLMSPATVVVALGAGGIKLVVLPLKLKLRLAVDRAQGSGEITARAVEIAAKGQQYTDKGVTIDHVIQAHAMQ